MGCALDERPIAGAIASPRALPGAGGAPAPVMQSVAAQQDDDVVDPVEPATATADQSAPRNTAGASAPAMMARTPTPAETAAGRPPDAEGPLMPDQEDAASDADLPGPLPIHRYTFDGEGVVVRDSVRNANGVVRGGELQGDGVVQLDGTRAGYVELPGGLLSRLHSATLEFWMEWAGDGSRRYERVFEFGRTSGNPSDPKVESMFFLSPNYDDGLAARVTIRSQSGETARVMASTRFPANERTHVVVVWNGDTRSLALYLNAKPAGEELRVPSLSSLRDDNAWLGRSQHVGDPFLAASFEEFRIYDVALSATDIERSFRRGPEHLPAGVP